MHPERRHRISRRTGWIGVAAILVVAVVLGLWLPRSLRGPDTVSRDFLEALIEAPQDDARLRAAGRLADDVAPDTLLDGLATRVTLEYLSARERQGASHDIRVVESQRPTPQRYRALLRVLEGADNRDTDARRFRIGLEKSDNGNWRVTIVTVTQ